MRRQELETRCHQQRAAGSVPDGPCHRVDGQEGLGEGAGILPADRRQLPTEPAAPGRQARHRHTYLNEKSTESLVLGANEFREFLTFYPTNAKADQAQFRLAQSYVKQMKAPERNQSATKEALKEFQVFFDRYPQSPLTPEVRKEWREARDRLSEASYLVGVHYYRVHCYPAPWTAFGRCCATIPSFPSEMACIST